MSKQITGARLNQGNHVYLYRLLRDALGCGKQTFMTQVEEALANGDMAAEDLGFESTRELLEELDDCIKLTVFKGGRIYATVIANEQWDAALAKGDEPKQKDAGKKQKSWKKKKGDKAIKAVRPKHVKRPKPEPEPEPQPEPTNQSEPAGKAEEQQTVETAPKTVVEDGPTKDGEATVEAAEPINSEIFSTEDEPAEEPAPDAAEEAEAAEPAAAPETLQPKISLTVVYDPEHANAGVTTLESTPVESVEPETAAEANGADHEPAPVPQQGEESEPETAQEPQSEPAADTEPSASAEPKPEPAPEPQPQPALAPKSQPEPAQEAAKEPKAAPAPVPEPAAAPVPELPKIPQDYPVDFALEVFCPGPLLHELSTYLPYGADALGIAGEYYWIARERGTIQASRNRATFPLRYTRDGKRCEIMVRIRRNQNGPGATWAIDKIETPSE